MKHIIKKTVITASIIIWWITTLWYTNAATGTWFWYNWYVSWYQLPRAGQWTFSDNESTLLDIIQNAINWVLWMLSLIALVLCLWGWFQMLTAWSDDSKVKSGTKILKNAALWLAIVWLSWLIVSFVFRIIGKTTWT